MDVASEKNLFLNRKNKIGNKTNDDESHYKYIISIIHSGDDHNINKGN